ncbi:DsbA family protein [Pseudovibrio sp. Ad37]|uniref:DsbA family protein n=1 Tax=Pseudovibrio sp. Ad37 TaxID=989422 RepID=UPI0007AEA70A|nr:DsbA family protein [Pseudovibrio sp. Ad37]KZL22701.1 Disulfide bond formation protein D precursor [Pseudovibrio sp. Ad37]
MQVTSINNELAQLRDVVDANAVKKNELGSMIKATIQSMADEREAEIQAALYQDWPLAKDDTGGRRIYGNVDARFTIVEYSDLECPYCKKFHETPKKVVEASNGNVNWQYKHLPLDFHNPAAKQQAVAAECVREQKGNKGFWVFVDEVFKRSGSNGQGVSDLPKLINEVGADIDQLQTCMRGGRATQIVERDVQRANDLNIRSTPSSFVVDNTTGISVPLSGAQPYEAVVAIIRRLAAKG